jgi:hypothetical protein
MRTERRQRRSDDPAQAIRFYLNALAQRRAHAGLALADADGLLIAGSEGSVDPEAMAAVAPLLADAAPAEQDGLLSLVTRGAPLNVWGVELEGQDCFLAAVGGTVGAPLEAGADLSRILA